MASTRRKVLLWVGLGVAVGLALEVGVTLRRAGVFRQLEWAPLSECTAVEGVPGPEDLTLHPSGAWAWVSSFDRRAWMAGREPTGAIFRYHPEDGRLVDATPAEPPGLHPHGLDLWVGEDGREVLFVVNHAGPSDHRVEIYDVVRWELRHRATVSGLRTPNDVGAAGPAAFYVTEDHGFPRGTARFLEEMLAAPLGSLKYWDGTELRPVQTGLAYPNGVRVTPDGRTLWLTETTGRRLRAYDRDPATGALEERHRVDLDTAPDNIEAEADGTLWIAAHPRTLDFVAHVRDPAARAPSEVLRVRPGPGGPVVESVALDDGSSLSAASTAAVHGDTLLLGAVFEDRFLVCRAP